MQTLNLVGRIPWIVRRTNTLPVFWRSSACQAEEVRQLLGELDVGSRVATLLEATATADGGHYVHLQIFHPILSVSSRRRDVFL